MQLIFKLVWKEKLCSAYRFCFLQCSNAMSIEFNICTTWTKTHEVTMLAWRNSQALPLWIVHWPECASHCMYVQHFAPLLADIPGEGFKNKVLEDQGMHNPNIPKSSNTFPAAILKAINWKQLASTSRTCSARYCIYSSQKGWCMGPPFGAFLSPPRFCTNRKLMGWAMSW